MKKLFTLFSFTVFLSLFQTVPVHAEDQLDKTLEDFIEAIIAGDNEKFHDTFINSFTSDPRLTLEDNVNEADVRRQLDNLMNQRQLFGTIISHDILTKQLCKDKIARVTWLAFAEDGQFFFSFNFFNVDGNWSIATINTAGQSGFEDFLDSLEENNSNFC